MHPRVALARIGGACRVYLEEVGSAVPQGHKVSFDVGAHFVMILGFGQLATLEGVFLLLDNGNHAEATALLRRLFFDSQRLAYIETHREDAGGLYLDLMWKQLNPRLGQLRALAKKTDLKPEDTGVDVGALLAEAEAEERELKQLAIDAGIERVRWPSPGEIARELGRTGDELVYASSSPAAKSALSQSSALSMEPGKTLVGRRSENPTDRRQLALAAGRLSASGLANTGLILGFEEYVMVVDDSHRRFRETIAEVPARLVEATD